MISFEGINTGDKVKLERDNGDCLVFTVEEEHGPYMYDVHHNSVYNDEWDKITVLERKLKPIKDGLYFHDSPSNTRVGYFAVKAGVVYYTVAGGSWVEATEVTFRMAEEEGGLILKFDWSE